MEIEEIAKYDSAAFIICELNRFCRLILYSQKVQFIIHMIIRGLFNFFKLPDKFLQLYKNIFHTNPYFLVALQRAQGLDYFFQQFG